VAFYDAIAERFRTAISTAVERFRRLIAPRMVRVYQYVVRVSGRVEPPTVVQRKKPREQTEIQFELSFEAPPFFRTLIADFKEAQRKFEPELLALVSQQELTATRMRSPVMFAQGVFSWTAEKAVEEAIAEIGFAPVQRLITEFLATATEPEKARFEMERKIRVPLRPKFVVTAVDFEPFGFIDVPEDMIRLRKAVDEFVFKLYRPDETVPFVMWRGSFEHSL
jgi:hypothetical protein